MLHLAALPDPELRNYLGSRPDEDQAQRRRVWEDVERARRNGFALNLQRSEKGLIAVGVGVRGSDGELVAGLTVSMPTCIAPGSVETPGRGELG